MLSPDIAQKQQKGTGVYFNRVFKLYGGNIDYYLPISQSGIGYDDITNISYDYNLKKVAKAYIPFLKDVETTQYYNMLDILQEDNNNIMYSDVQIPVYSRIVCSWSDEIILQFTVEEVKAIMALGEFNPNSNVKYWEYNLSYVPKADEKMSVGVFDDSVEVSETQEENNEVYLPAKKTISSVSSKVGKATFG